MNTRREFLGLLASASGAFLLPPELRAAVEEGVRLRIGVLSDLHLDFGHSYGEYWKLERALAYFRDQNVDAVWHAKKGTFTSAADYDFTVVPFDSFRTRAV